MKHERCLCWFKQKKKKMNKNLNKKSIETDTSTAKLMLALSGEVNFYGKMTEGADKTGGHDLKLQKA
jgi:hypothetical protein